MEHVAALMLILGCNEISTVCERADLPQMKYESIEACEKEIESRMLHPVTGYPMIVGKCVAVDPAVEADWKLAWNMEEGGQLTTHAIPVQANDRISGPIRVASR